MNGSHCFRVFFVVLSCAFAWVQHLNVRGVVTMQQKQRLSAVAQANQIPRTDTAIPLDDFMTKLQNQLQNQVINTFVISETRKNLKIVSSTPDFLLDVQSVAGRYVQLKGETKYQLAYKYRTKEQVKNYDLNEAVGLIRSIIVTGLFKSAHFHAQDMLHKLDIKTPPGILLEYRYKVQKAPLKKSSNINAIDMMHDRSKNTFVPIEAPFLEQLGITYKETVGEGPATRATIVRPRIGMVDKLGQIQKFLEVLDGIVKANPLLKAKAGQDLKIVDMGSGLAYLTFAVHSHFCKTYPGLQTKGVEKRADLTDRTNTIARGLGEEFVGLSFQTGSIDGDVQEGASTESVKNDVDVLIALHACDTATDDAILHGIKRNASIIVVSPCCHKELRRQLDLHEKTEPSLHPLTEVLVHGIYRERQSEMLTDSLRALCLQSMGYDTKIFEFVGGEHTAKNTMITATKRSAPLAGADKEDLLKKMRALMASFGIGTQRLAAALGLGAPVVGKKVLRLNYRGRRNGNNNK